MNDKSKLTEDRRKSIQLFIVRSLIREIKCGKAVNLSKIPPEIIELLPEAIYKRDDA